jgi:hypothetical protein
MSYEKSSKSYTLNNAEVKSSRFSDEQCQRLLELRAAAIEFTKVVLGTEYDLTATENEIGTKKEEQMLGSIVNILCDKIADNGYTNIYLPTPYAGDEKEEVDDHPYIVDDDYQKRYGKSTQRLEVEMKLDVEASAVPEVRGAIEHRIESVLDLDSWPEIKSVYGCKATAETIVCDTSIHDDNRVIASDR